MFVIRPLLINDDQLWKLKVLIIILEILIFQNDELAVHVQVFKRCKLYYICRYFTSHREAQKPVFFIELQLVPI